MHAPRSYQDAMPASKSRFGAEGSHPSQQCYDLKADLETAVVLAGETMHPGMEHWLSQGADLLHSRRSHAMLAGCGCIERFASPVLVRLSCSRTRDLFRWPRG